MKKTIIIVVAVAVSSVGFLLGRTSAKTSLAEGQVPVNCSILKTNGTLKGFSDGFMLFEDSAGTIRIMGNACNVVYKFDRR